MFDSGSSSRMRKNAAFEPLLSTRAQNPWSQDDNKIGQKMLEKMGWKKGQGVGLHNQGMVQNIKLIGNKGSKGLGFRVKQDDLWNAASDNFSNLLSELSNGSEIELKSKLDQSLQLRSQRSRSRVFYKKFSRGKDISEYDMKDLSCVIGGLDEDISKKIFMDVSDNEMLIKVNEVNSNSPVSNNIEMKTEVEETVEKFKPERKRKRTEHSVKKECTNENENLTEEIPTLETEMKKNIEDFKLKSKKIKLEDVKKEPINENEKSFEKITVQDTENDESIKKIKRKRIKKSNKSMKKESSNENEKSFENATAPDTVIEESITKPKLKNRKRKSKNSIKEESSNENNVSCEKNTAPETENEKSKNKTKKSKNKSKKFKNKAKNSKNKTKKSKKSVKKETKKIKEKSPTILVNEVKNLLTETKNEGNVEDMKKFISKFEEEASQLMKKHNEELNQHETYRLNQNKEMENIPRSEKAIFKMKLVQEIRQNNFVPNFKGSNLSIIEGYPTSRRYARTFA